MLSTPLKISSVVGGMTKRRLSDAAGASVKPQALRLARLPVPTLRSTLDKYLKSIEPLAYEDELRGGPSFDEAMSLRASWAKEFEDGLGKTLQERLLELDRQSPHNWLEDNFWTNHVYLDWRAPVLINSNWWLAFGHDSNVPSEISERNDQNTRKGISGWQIRRAAWLSHRILDFKDRFNSQELYPDTTKTGLWFRNTVPRMFNKCRIPRRNRDELKIAPSSSPHSSKIVLMIRDWMYAVDVYDGKPSNVGHQELERRFRSVLADVDEREGRGERPFAVGLLTSDDRDKWAENRERLLQLPTVNHETISVIEDSIMTVSLDDYTYQSPDAQSYTDPQVSERRSHLHNIRSGNHAHNRWFDKPITLIVERNSRAGMSGEHSPVDALVPSIVAEYALAEEIDPSWPFIPLKNDVTGDSDASSRWQQLNWIVDEHIQREIRASKDRARNIIEDSDDNVFWFSDYGVDWIKEKGGFSPDAYVQMAMQLASYNSRGTFTATYETALTRLFEHGRTETIRTLTREAQTFVLTMKNVNASNRERFDALSRAVRGHVKLTREAMTGHGIDRHLFGLRLLMKPGESSELFSDSFFDRSQEWKLSTSGLSAGSLFRGTGFGASYNDGYGINYLAGPDMIKFGIESKHSCANTSTEDFARNLFSCLRQMKELILDQKQPTTQLDDTRSRL